MSKGILNIVVLLFSLTIVSCQGNDDQNHNNKIIIENSKKTDTLKNYQKNTSSGIIPERFIKIIDNSKYYNNSNTTDYEYTKVLIDSILGIRHDSIFFSGTIKGRRINNMLVTNFKALIDKKLYHYLLLINPENRKLIDKINFQEGSYMETDSLYLSIMHYCGKDDTVDIKIQTTLCIEKYSNNLLHPYLSKGFKRDFSKHKNNRILNVVVTKNGFLKTKQN